MLVLLVLISAFILGKFAPPLYQFFEKSSDGKMVEVFFIVASVFLLSALAFYSSKKMQLPSFVMAIAFGLSAKPFLNPITLNGELLGIFVGLGATLILFGGGLETPFQNFKRLFWKIFTVSFLGLFLSAWLFSLAVFTLCKWFGQEISMQAAILLGALLASTDPAAIIPLLKNLRFKNRFVKDLVVSESAVTDVSGTLLTVAFLSIITKGLEYGSINEWYLSIFSVENGSMLGLQVLFGVAAGLLGFIVLKFLHHRKGLSGVEHEVDSAIFLFVPIFIFAIALSLGGSGYLAAFVAGLVFSLTEKLRATENFFNFLVEGFMKPAVFIFLGALVDIPALISYAGVGLIAALVFMLIIRPLIVFISLGAWRFAGKDRLTIPDLIFISFVRETGAIPAVLLTTIIGMNLAGMSGLVEIGMWVILSTLIIEPIFTPWVAKRLGVAEEIGDSKKVEIQQKGTVTILGSRGDSFLNRLQLTSEWASQNTASHQVIVLLCLENNHTPEEEIRIRNLAENEFVKVNQYLSDKGLSQVTFSIISRKGFLENNLSEIAKEYGHEVVLFIGRKMIDLKLEEVKQLGAPIYFLE